MTFSGDLNGINLADVFQNIHANRATGTLLVESRAGERFVHFHEGMIAAFSLGRGKGLPIVEQIVKRGLVAPKRMEALTRKRKSSRRLLRVLLDESGDLTEDRFRQAVGEIVREHLYELLRLREARFSFSEGEPPQRVFDTETKAVQLRIDPAGVLIESARRMDEWSRIDRVIGSEHDLFVLLEGWDQIEMDQVMADVAARLDGRTSVRALLEALPHPRFDVCKAISDLVLRGVARPCKADEIEALIQTALAEDDAEAAVELMTRALGLERNNRALRRQLADLLERLGRNADAAAELAQLGYQAAQEHDHEQALACYERAARLNPDDLMLHEQRLELLRHTGPIEEQTDGVIDVVDLLLARGLADRARTVLRSAMASKALRHHAGLIEKLAEVEAALGNDEQACELLLQSADRVAADDQTRSLILLRKAAALRPDDEVLARRIRDLETGRARQRRTKLRRLVAAAAVACVLVSLSVAGIVDLIAAHRLLAALDERLPQISGGDPGVAVGDVQSVYDDYGWTPSGRRAQQVAERLVEAQLRAVDELRRNGKHADALRTLERLADVELAPALRKRLDALLTTVRLEGEAHEVLVRANSVPPDEAACRALERMGDIRLLGFHRDNLRWARPGAQRALLRALLAIDDPAAAVAAARTFVTSDDREVVDISMQILQQATAVRDAKREQAWAEVYPELEEAAERGGSERARQVLRMLRGR